jgi:hypothetical protein
MFTSIPAATCGKSSSSSILVAAGRVHRIAHKVFLDFCLALSRRRPANRGLTSDRLQSEGWQDNIHYYPIAASHAVHTPEASAGCFPSVPCVAITDDLRHADTVILLRRRRTAKSSLSWYAWRVQDSDSNNPATHVLPQGISLLRHVDAHAPNGQLEFLSQNIA